MNPEALEAAYKLFTDTGYNGSSDDFSKLISSNQEALDVSFSQFVETGYNGNGEDFKFLLGVSDQNKDLKVEETTIQEPEVESEKPKMTKAGSDISFEEFNNIEEEPLIEELEKKYGDYLEFDEPITGGGYINDAITVTNKKTGEEIRLNLNTKYNAGRGAEFSDEKGYSVYKDFLSFANNARFNEEGGYTSGAERTLGENFVLDSGKNLPVSKEITEKALELVKNSSFENKLTIDEAIDEVVNSSFGEMNTAWNTNFYNKENENRVLFQNKVVKLVDEGFNPNPTSYSKFSEKEFGSQIMYKKQMMELGVPESVFQAQGKNVNQNVAIGGVGEQSNDLKQEEIKENIYSYLKDTPNGRAIMSAYDSRTTQSGIEEEDKSDLKEYGDKALENRVRIESDKAEKVFIAENASDSESPFGVSKNDLLKLKALKEKSLNEKDPELREKYSNELLAGVRNMLDDGKINLLRTADGGFVDEVKDVQVKQSKAKQQQNAVQLEKYMFKSGDELLDLFRKQNFELKSLANDIVKQGYVQTFRDANIPQQVGEVLSQAYGAVTYDFKGTAYDDINKLKNWVENGEMPEYLTTLPEASGSNELITKYNDLLEQRSINLLAQQLNVDPMTYGKSDYGVKRMLDQAAEETIPALGGRYLGETQSRKVALDVFEEAFDIERTVEQKALVNHLDSWEAAGAQVPALARMGAEIYVTNLLSGGSASITKGIQSLSKVAMKKAGLGVVKKGTEFVLTKGGQRAANYASIVGLEYIGLTGSNIIERNVFDEQGIDNPLLFSMAAGGSRLLFSKASSMYNDAIIKAAGKPGNENLRQSLLWISEQPGTASRTGALDYAKGIAQATTRTGVRAAGIAGEALTGAVGIKAGEVPGGLIDVVQGEKTMSQLFNEITDSKSLIETAGALLFMRAARPDQYVRKAVDGFYAEVDMISGNNPEWNRMRTAIGLKALGPKEGSKTAQDPNYIFKLQEAYAKKLNEISKGEGAYKDLDEEQRNEAYKNLEFNFNRLKMKPDIDQLAEEYRSNDNKLGDFTELENSALNITRSGGTAKDFITLAGGGESSAIIQLMANGLTEVKAKEVLDTAVQISEVGNSLFAGNLTGKNFQDYVNESMVSNTLSAELVNLEKRFKANNIEKSYYDYQKDILEKQLDLSNKKQQKSFQAEAAERVINQAKSIADAKAAGINIFEGNNKQIEAKKKELGGKFAEQEFGLQGIDKEGNPIILINTESTKKYLQAGTEVHEIFHIPHELRFSERAIETRALEIAKEKSISEADAKVEAEKEVRDYLDDFIGGLKDKGLYDRVLKEMIQRNIATAEALLKGEQLPISEAKEFINEFIQLDAAKAFDNIKGEKSVKDANKLSKKEISELEFESALDNGKEFINFVLSGKYRSKNINNLIKNKQSTYKDLMRGEEASMNLSEKSIKELEEVDNESLVKRILDKETSNTEKGNAIEALVNKNPIIWRKLGYNKAKGDVLPKDIRNSIIDELLGTEGGRGILKTYKPEANIKFVTYLGDVIGKRKQQIYKRAGLDAEKLETDRLSDERVKEIADAETPETIIEAKESNVVEKERQISTFEGKEANRKKKEILEVAETIDLQDIKPGVGGAPKKQLGQIGELVFEIPAEKISDPKKNLTFAKNLINIETGKAAKKGEKGVISDSEFGNIQKFFSDNSNMKRFIKTLPETNVTSDQAIINKQGESIDVSREVLGRGIGLPKRVIKYFYEPTGKRSKGLTSQTPVYKLKPEFKNATPETINKVQGDLLIGKDLKNYDRTVNGQLAKGMAVVEAMKVTNEAMRSKIPTETAAAKKLVADIKAGASKLSMSTKMTQKAIMKSLMGEFDFYNPKSIIKAKKSIIDKYAPIFGKELTNRMFSDLTPSGGRGNKVYGLQIAIGSLKSLQSQRLKRNLSKKEIEVEARTIGQNLSLIENNLILDISELKNSIEKAGLKENPAAKIIMEAFGKSQTINNLASNLLNLKSRKKATKDLIEMFKKAYDADPAASALLREFIYNNKASGMLGKDVALMRGKHKNAKKGDVYEEHTYPFSSWAIRTMDAITNKNPKVLEGWKEWAAENYYQTAFDKTTKAPFTDVKGQHGYYQGVVDQTFKRVDGKGDFKSQSQEHPVLEAALNEAFKTGDFSKVPASEIRFFNEYVQLNPNQLYLDGKTYAEKYDVVVDKFLENNPAIVKAQSDLIYEQLTNKIDSNTARERLDKIIKARGTKQADRAFKETKTEIDEPGVMNTSEKMTTEELIKKARTIDKALQMADRPNMPKKKIRIFDFDDTVARTNSKVFAEREGERIELTAEEFAEKGMELIDQGYEMDFTDFNRVVEGKKGPLFELIKKLKESPGERDLFILTARAPESQQAIFEFMKAMGVEIPLKNITGLGNSTGEAKANWIIDKAAEGYNDFYFADDAPQNVKAVKKAMSQLDVKSKVQLAKENKINFSEKKTKELDWKTDEAGNIKTTFNIGKKKYNFNLDARDSKGSFDVEFNLGGRIDMTGTGDAVKVIRTVYNGLLDIVGKTPKIKRLEFSSLKSETSRVKLYTTLMDRVAKKLGWETDIWESNNFVTPDKSGYDFEITKPRKKQVAPVEKALNVIDVKSKVQKARLNTSEKMNTEFNKIIEESTGIGAEKIFSDVKAEIRGNKARRQKFFIPPSAEDFTGLLYRTLGKGKKGEAHMKFYQDALLDPYARAMENLSTDRVNLMADFKALKKQLDVPKDLRKTTESGFTNEQAVRTYLWNKAGQEIPGLSKTDMKELSDLVENNPKLKVFADQIMSITKGDGYSTPTKNWATGTITTDLIDVLNTTKRAKYLETWNQNKDVIFSKDNLNKLEAAYGTKYKESMENILTRMKSGRNRIEGGNVLSNKVLDYINNSTGAIMFFNTRSAVLQTISAANFINWGFNNPLRAGAAFANQPQYWKDFTKLINSDYLKDRRNGLKLNISESEIADAAKTSTNKAKAGLNYILEKGYLPTKFADSFAIASGGATFYRNRIKDLIKNEGKTEKEAEAIAMREFREVSEISQQSSDPSKTSSQQASTLGRVVLQFANTPMQYARIQKRAVQDIVNGRGDLKTNISKIAYYGFLQNMLFNSLQQGLFALGFGDDEIDEKEEQKIIKMANGMVDSSLRGLGFAGVTIQVLKNLGIDLYDRSKRDRPEYSDSYIKLLDFSPAVKSKLTKFRGAAYPFDSKKRRAEVFEKGFSLNNPAYESMAKVVTATTNLPLDRLYSKVNNLSAAMDDETETWQSIAMVLGWPEWQIKGRQNYVEAPKTEEEKIKIKEQKIKIKEEKSKTRLKEAKGSTDFETLKKLNKSEQLKLLKNMGVGNKNIRKYKKLKEADLIEEIIKRNKK